LRGPVLIHAGKSKSDTGAEALAYIKRRYRVADLPEKFETGGIVGIAEITDCVRRHRSKWFHGPFGWVLANARRLPFKPCKGQLKFFTPHTGKMAGRPRPGVGKGNGGRSNKIC
jgi:hypothetical protein